jgi:hypothetical protein
MNIRSLVVSRPLVCMSSVRFVPGVSLVYLCRLRYTWPIAIEEYIHATLALRWSCEGGAAPDSSPCSNIFSGVELLAALL